MNPKQKPILKMTLKPKPYLKVTPNKVLNPLNLNPAQLAKRSVLNKYKTV